MVIEIKGQGIDLDKRQIGRSNNKSPVEQAFGYALNTAMLIGSWYPTTMNSGFIITMKKLNTYHLM